MGLFAYAGGLSSLGSERADGLSNPTGFEGYMAHTGNVFGGISERFLGLGLAPILWAYEAFGIWGGGLGIATQGVQALIPNANYIGAAEGGFGKIVLELGIIGFFLVLLLGIVLVRHIWKLLKFVSCYSRGNASCLRSRRHF